MQYPGWDLSRAQKIAIRQEAYRIGILAAIRRGIGQDELSLVVRETNAGASAATTDTELVDLTFKTAATAGMQEWTIDSADLTAGDLSSVLTAALKIPDDKIVVIYGFWDRTAAPDLCWMRFTRGQEVLDVWNVEGNYVQSQEVNGFTNEPMLFEDDDVIKWEVNAKSAADKPIGLYGYTVERAGVNVSSVRRRASISEADIVEAVRSRRS